MGDEPVTLERGNQWLDPVIDIGRERRIGYGEECKRRGNPSDALVFILVFDQ